MESVQKNQLPLSKIEKRTRTIGLFLGPIFFLLVLFLDPPQAFFNIAKSSLPSDAALSDVRTLVYSTKITFALLLLMVVWWITEAVPIPITALLPGLILPLFHVYGSSNEKLYEFTGKAILLNYAHPIIFLFLSGFLLAAAMQKWSLDKRLTLFILSRGRLADSSKLVLLGMMSISAFLSMWISNTAATAMLLPLGLGIIAQSGANKTDSNFGKSLMLGIAYAATIGGVGTIIGSPTNGICVSILSASKIAEINFLDWMKFGVPFVILFIPVAWFVLIKVFPPEIEKLQGGKALILAQKNKLGKWNRGEKMTVIVFLIVVLLWITNPFWEMILPENISSKLGWFDESLIALFGAILLFLFPVDWKERTFILEWSDSKVVDWGTLLLFGGGIALSDAMFRTGLAGWIANSAVSIVGTPSAFLLILIIVPLTVILSEITSNTAQISMMMPILISIAYGTGVDPLAITIAAAVATSMGFMLPVATPPNALVYGSGYIRMKDMIKVGSILDVLGWIFSIFAVVTFAYKIFGIIKL
ncbi:MAG: DASS family sodium-coupled anion symporter [Bacteroidetes bacterium]|nr:DASS family sodium-coupled anion symporter [Bacteroidota bacterium]MBU2585749.1 DASS family sodium-coupled anion symporter [Bacteroidota bacterium]